MWAKERGAWGGPDAVALCGHGRVEMESVASSALPQGPGGWGRGVELGVRSLASPVASRSILALSFQSHRQRSEATNNSNLVFLYCAFLDFRYACGGPGAGTGGEGSRCGGRTVPRARPGHTPVRLGSGHPSGGNRVALPVNAGNDLGPGQEPEVQARFSQRPH